MLLLSYYGTILLKDHRGVLVHKMVSQCDPTDEFVRLAPPVALRSVFPDFVNDHAIEQRCSVELLEAKTIELRILPDQRCVRLAMDGQLLQARFGQEEVRFDASEPVDNAVFLMISDQELAQIRFLTSHTWFRKSLMKVVTPDDITFEWSFQLNFGGIVCDLRDNLPFLTDETPYDAAEARAGGGQISSIRLLFDGWRVDDLVLFRPLIYSAAFRSPAVLGQLQTCIESLFDIGQYQGDLHVITDQTRAEILAMAPSISPDRISVQYADPNDFAGYCGARYLITDWDQARSYQPLLYVDPDVVFDADVQSMLEAVVLAPQVTAPSETFSPIQHKQSVGSHLLWVDNCDGGDRVGFNSGTHGIPNLSRHEGTLRLIKAAVVGHAKRHGRRGLGWADQEMANYLAFKTACIEAETLSPFVRHGFAGVENDVAGASGMVHFWPPHFADVKLEAMRTYLAGLRARRDAAAPGQACQDNIAVKA